MRFVVIDNCPVPALIAEEVKALKRDVPSARLQSAYRGDLAAGLLKRLGKSTQAMLYRGWLKRLPGFNPANPPGFSTHELHSDAVAYRGPRGRLIRAWGCGLDWNDPDVEELITAAKGRGWQLWRPYSAGSERHHVNFRKRPVLKRKTKRKGVPGKKLGPLHVSEAAVRMVADFEGFRTRAYKDAVGVWTIGYGETDPVTIKRYSAHGIPQADAKRLLRNRLNHGYAPPVVKLAKTIGLKLRQNEFDALVSAVYNLGPGILDKDRTMGAALRSKNRRRIADAFLVYDKAGNPPRPLAGLTRRRQAERKLFLKGTR